MLKYVDSLPMSANCVQSVKTSTNSFYVMLRAFPQNDLYFKKTSHTNSFELTNLKTSTTMTSIGCKLNISVDLLL